MPTAWAHDRAFGLYPLSTIARYARSLGTPSCSKIRHMPGRYRPDRSSHLETPPGDDRKKRMASSTRLWQSMSISDLRAIPCKRRACCTSSPERSSTLFSSRLRRNERIGLSSEAPRAKPVPNSRYPFSSRRNVSTYRSNRSGSSSGPISKVDNMSEARSRAAPARSACPAR